MNNNHEVLSVGDPQVNEEGAKQYHTFKELLLEHGTVTKPTTDSGGPESDLHTFMFYSTLGFPIDAGIVGQGLEGVEVSTSATLETPPSEVIEDVRNDNRIIIIKDVKDRQETRYTIKLNGDVDAEEHGIKPMETGEYEYRPSLQQSLKNKVHTLRFRNSDAYRSRVMQDLEGIAQKARTHAEAPKPQPAA